MYDYRAQRAFVFTEEGQVMFLAIRDKAQWLLGQAGTVRCDKLISALTGGSWDMLACVDRLVELGELRELTEVSRVAGQDRVFVKGTR